MGPNRDQKLDRYKDRYGWRWEHTLHLIQITEGGNAENKNKIQQQSQATQSNAWCLVYQSDKNQIPWSTPVDPTLVLVRLYHSQAT